MTQVAQTPYKPNDDTGVQRAQIGSSETWANDYSNETYVGQTKSTNLFCQIEIAGNIVTSSLTEGLEEWTGLATENNILDITRQTNPNPTQDKKDSGRVIVQNTPLLIPHEKNSIDIIQALLDGSDCNIRVQRVGHFAGEQRKPIEEYSFLNSQIQRTVDKSDMFLIIFRCAKITKIVHSYDREGQVTGSAEITYDIALNKTE